MALNDFNVTENFNLREFQCKCGCEQVKIGHDLIILLQKLRSKLGIPITIVSGYRCSKHNASVGGAKDSFHIQGRAVDIVAKVDLNTICKIAKEVGFKGIGKYPDESFVHLDNRDKECYWVKYWNKPYKYTTFEDVLKS